MKNGTLRKKRESRKSEECWDLGDQRNSEVSKTRIDLKVGFFLEIAVSVFLEKQNRLELLVNSLIKNHSVTYRKDRSLQSIFLVKIRILLNTCGDLSWAIFR